MLHVAIDDFAIRKSVTYGTLIIDLTTNRAIDMIASRKLEDVERWLKTFKNIKVVSRDGSKNIQKRQLIKHYLTQFK